MAPDTFGAIFYFLWVVMFFATSTAPGFVADRHRMVDAYAASHYGIVLYNVAQVIASLPFNLGLSFIFSLPYFYLVQFNLSASTFFYFLLLGVVLQLFTESLVWNVVEATRDPKMAVTMATTALGTFVLYSGFFVGQEAMPPATSWVPYAMPTRYLLQGALTSVFSDQQYFDATLDAELDGDTVLSSVFNVRDVDIWVSILIGLAFTLLFRIQHVVYLWQQIHALGAAPKKMRKSKDAGLESTTPLETVQGHGGQQLMDVQPSPIAVASV